MEASPANDKFGAVNSMTATDTDKIRRRIEALEADVRAAEAKAERLATSIDSRRKTLARLRAQLDEIERGAAHVKNAL